MSDAMTMRVRPDLLGRPLIPALIGTAYGVYGFVVSGLGVDHALRTYALVGGGLASIAALTAYDALMFVPEGRSWGKVLMGLGGLLPYFYSLFLMGYLGLYSLWLLFAEHFSLGRLAFGVVWLLLGYRLLYTFWQITEIGAARHRATTP